jgi:hypothetical protein
MNADDLNFAYKVRHALNEHLDHLPPSTADRLASARKLAVSRKKAHVPARVVLALVVGMAGIYEYEEQERIAELAELDAAVLSDELPLTAYLDQGFNAYLAQRGQ